MSVPGVEFVFGVGGTDKANSSSWILGEWKAPRTPRTWGYYRVLHEVEGTKVKELTVEPGQTLSMQRHRDRAEYWHISAGRCVVESADSESYLETHDNYLIPTNEWHRLYNPFTEPCKIVEIQYGPNCTEDDIERR
jgi:mannose-6-phosphate isomerase-like protein (cupin superfamily)